MKKSREKRIGDVLLEQRFLFLRFLVLFFLSSLPGPVGAEDYAWLEPVIYNPEEAIEKRIPAPQNFTRLPVENNGFASWLRGLKLKPEGSHVCLYPVANGRLKDNQEVHVAVVDMDVLRFQECADAVIRLRSEYLWSTNRADEVCFNFTSGDRCCWQDWREGRRPRTVSGGMRVIWKDTGVTDSSREQFIKYMDKVMEFAGTASLSRELSVIRPRELEIGDVIIQGGRPGHAVVVLDMVENEQGVRKMLLGQSYMPAQEFHVLQNSDGGGSPWYAVDFGDQLTTPEWTFSRDHCRTFR